MDWTLIWALAAFNALFLGVFVSRRIMGYRPLTGVVAVLAQSTFIAVNCMIFFPEEVAFYAGRLMRLF